MREKIATGLDIGSSKVAVVIGHRAEGETEPDIVGVGIQQGEGLRRGVVTDVEETVRMINQAVEEAERMAGAPLDNVQVSVNGVHINSASGRGMISIPRHKGEITSDDVVRVVESAQAVSLPVNREIIHIIPRSFIVDGQGGVKDPVGMMGVRLELDAHVVTGSTPFLKNLRKTLGETGVNSNALVLSPLAASKAVLSKKQKELGVVLIDIGAGTTGMVVFQDGHILHSAVSRVGASDIVSDIAIGLRTSLEVAEAVLLEYGIASSLTVGDKESIDLQKFDPNEESVISRRELAEIIEARVLDILTFVREELRKINQDGTLPAGAVLVGGGANLPGLVELVKSNLGLPAQLGYPQELKGMVDRLNNPRYAGAIGLMLWGLEEEEESGFIPTEVNLAGLWDKIRSWFK